MTTTFTDSNPAPAEFPQPPLMGLARLMRLAFNAQNLGPLAHALIARAEANPQDAHALMDLSTVLQLQGLRDVGLATLEQALNVSRCYELPSERPPVVRLLAIMAFGDIMSNAPLPFLFENSDVALTMLYVLPGELPPAELPPHDVVFIAVSESSVNHSVLMRLAAHPWPQPVINPARLIEFTSRTQAHAALLGIPGLHMVPTRRLTRENLEQLVASQVKLDRLVPGADWPLIVRPLDSHAGQGLEKIDTQAELDSYLAQLDSDAFYVSRFVDYRSADGLFRKYRVVLIDGEPFASHMGVSAHWMIHYLNAGMADDAAKRDEERAFMEAFDTAFAVRHGPALKATAQRMELAYLVLDCAEMPNGDLLIFELDTGAVVHAMDPEDLFPYKHPAMKKVFAAFHALLLRVSGRGGVLQAPDTPGAGETNGGKP
jgi:hypothetical protein